RSVGLETSDDYATVAYDASTGAQLWVARYSFPGVPSQDDAYALAVSPDGARVFVTGESIGTSGEGDYATLAYDAFTGDQLWVARYASQAGGAAYALAMNPSGTRIFV